MFWRKKLPDQLADKIIKNLKTSPDLWELDIYKLTNVSHRLAIILRNRESNKVEHFGISRETGSDIVVDPVNECSLLTRYRLEKAVYAFRGLEKGRLYLEGLSLVPNKEDNPEAFV